MGVSFTSADFCHNHDAAGFNSCIPIGPPLWAVVIWGRLPQGTVAQVIKSQDAIKRRETRVISRDYWGWMAHGRLR
jgi:hypothetical protein